MPQTPRSREHTEPEPTGAPAFRLGQEQYRLIVEQQNDLVITFTPAGRLLYASPRYCETFGKTEQELVGQTFMPLIHEDDRQRVAESLRQLFVAPYTCAHEERALTSAGWRWLAWSDRALLDAKGQIVEIIAVGRDITERKQAEIEYKTILQTALDGFWITDTADGRFLDVNEAYCQMMGYARDELLQMRISDIEAAEQPEETRQHIATLITQGYDRFETRHRGKNGVVREVEVSAQYSDVRGGVFVVFVKDITERKQNEAELRAYREKLEDMVQARTAELEHSNRQLQQAQQAAEAANRAKSEFLSNISHEIRTPLNAVLGVTDILHAQLHDTRLNHYVSLISRNGKALLQLMNDILELSKLEAGKIELARGVVNLRQLLGDIEQLFTQHIAEKGLRWQIELDPALPDRLLLAEHGLRQILLNLIGNAVKFTEKGSVTVRILASGCEMSALKEAQSHRSFPTSKIKNLKFEIIDTGIGIPPEQQAAIFKAFTPKHTQGRTFGGTGLGLAITKRLVEMLHGEISVTSQVGQGSTFRVALPNIEFLAPDSALQNPPAHRDRPELQAQDVSSPSDAELSKTGPMMLAALPAATKEKLPGLLHILETVVLPHCQAVQKMLIMDDVRAFAEEVGRLGVAWQIPNLTEYGRALEHYIADYDIEAIERTLAGFSDCMKNIQRAVEEGTPTS